MKDEKKISLAVIRRLPKYYRYLSVLRQMGIGRVSSIDLGRHMEITPSQVRQDFFHFGCYGLQGYGYEVGSLMQGIGKILGLDRVNTMVIIGSGKLGRALANHSSFEKRGFKIIGMFDVNPNLVGKAVRGMEIRHIDHLQDFLAQHAVDIAVIAVPRLYARETAERVIGYGIKGIWNFASVEFGVPEDVAVEHIHFSESLMALSYKLKEKRLAHISQWEERQGRKDWGASE
jgi:redox-sensing transcriptional repressor